MTTMRLWFYRAVLVAGFMAGASMAPAEQLDFSSSLNPVGSGARAAGMGGAFIGVADDATAASWNPAGLVQLERPEISIVYSYFNHCQSYDLSLHPEINGSDCVGSNKVNYASAAYPFVAFNRNIIVSLNYQYLYDMTKKNNFTQNFGTLDSGQRNFSQTGKLYAFSPAMAVQVIEGLYLGATANIWQPIFGQNGWEDSDSYAGSVLSFSVHNKASFSGLNGNFGILWNATDKFTLGGVYKTGFDADLKVETDRTFAGTTLPPLSVDYTLRMPASYGFGIAYRHNDKLTLSTDVYVTEWSDFILINKVNGMEFNPVYGDELSNGHLRNTVQWRLGAEYLFIDQERVIPLRGGLFYDPVPQRGRLDDYYGFSIGSGISLPRFSFDVAYQFRFASNVNGNLGTIQEKSVDIRQHTVFASLIWYFK